MTRAITIIRSAVIAAALAAGCDRIVNLTPAYDGRPALDAHTDSSFGLDVGPADAHPALDDGPTPPDGIPTPDGGFPDGNPTPDDAIAPAG